MDEWQKRFVERTRRDLESGCNVTIVAFGDSITAGYGLDGANASCSVSQDNSNHYLTYGAVAARALSAELHAIAWSGIGMYRNTTSTGDKLYVDWAQLVNSVAAPDPAVMETVPDDQVETTGGTHNVAP